MVSIFLYGSQCRTISSELKKRFKQQKCGFTQGQKNVSNDQVYENIYGKLTGKLHYVGEKSIEAEMAEQYKLHCILFPGFYHRSLNTGWQ